MSDSFYFFYQQESKNSWTLALASDRDRVNREIKPELNTVLNVNCAFESDMSIEERDKVRYVGPMYFDFDSEDLDEVIPQFKELLLKLQAKGLNLSALRLYCSGGKGFHIEMPQPLFMSKMPPHGVAALPLIYREVAHELFVNTLDLRVYSMGKGRQWRQPNIKRANGNHKVQITAEEAMTMTPEMYADFIKYPRPLFPSAEPVFNPDIALIYAKARDKVENGIKNRKKRKKTTDELNRFNGEWPETLRTILSGQGLKDKIGWNYLCIQVAIAADALGKTEEQLMKDAEGLIESYAGDSKRYGTQSLRRTELRNKFRYFQGSPCYDFSIGGILSLVDKETLDNSDLTLGEYVPDGTEDEDQDGDADKEDDTTRRVRINRNGMYARTDNGWKNISHLGMADPVLLMLPEGKHIGYDIEVLVDAKSQGRTMLVTTEMSTKSSMNNFAVRFNASFRGTDMDASNILDAMRHRVLNKSKVSLVTQVEGIDLILPPGAKSEDEMEIIWSSPYGVISTGNNTYTYRPLPTQGAATYRSDLYNAELLSDCPEDREMISDMLTMNSPNNMARILGWFGSTFMCPILRKYHGQFPLLMVFGGATAGKSKTIALLSHMFYHLQKPKILQASGMTKFPLLVASSSSSSIPLVIEELRYRLMQAGGMYQTTINTLKSNYDGHDQARGALGEKGSGAVVNEFANTAPIVFTAEEQNDEVAVQERSVQVCMTKGDRQGREEHYQRLLDRAPNLGRLGKSMLVSALHLDIPEFRKEFTETRNLVRRSIPNTDGLDRPIYNLAVVMVGLKFMQRTIQRVFGDEFDEKFEVMTDYVIENIGDFVPKNMSEVARILDTMAQLSKSLDVSVRLEQGRDYAVDEAAGTVDIKLKPAYAKYMKYMRSLGLAPLLANDSAFVAAMNRYEGTRQRACPGSPLFQNPFEIIYQFDVATLERDQVEPFKP